MMILSSRKVRPGYWFAQRRYGVGAVPANAAGWAAVSVFGLLLGLNLLLMPGELARIATAAVLILGFTLIAWIKTDGGWRWRWGD